MSLYIMTTIVDGNSAILRNIHSETGSVDKNNLDIIYDYYRLQILFNNIIFQLKPPMLLYSGADFENFLVSMPNIIQFTQNIENDDTFKYGTETVFETDYEYDSNLVGNYRTLTTDLIDVLTQAISEYYKIKNLEQENTELLSYKDILQDRTKLLDYISEIQTTSYLFSAEATYTNDLEIKLWYQVYLERHGPPGDGVFESVKLSAIIDELVESGQVSQDELIY
mgnify:FL=1|jgi:hypothetical protein